jgi:hypothetical protein
MSKTTAKALNEAVKPASIQKFVRLREVTGDVLCLKHPNSMFSTHLRSYRAVLQVGSINFSLMSEREQEAILTAYRVLINSLRSYGIDIHIRIEPCDLRGYEAHLRAAALLAPFEEVEAHCDFIETLASERALTQRRF